MEINFFFFFSTISKGCFGFKRLCQGCKIASWIFMKYTSVFELKKGKTVGVFLNFWRLVNNVYSERQHKWIDCIYKPR